MNLLSRMHFLLQYLSDNNVPSAQAYTFAAPAGVPGSLSRTDESSVEPAMLKANASTFFPQSFGVAMTYRTGGIGLWDAASVAADFAGVLVRQAPGISENDQGLTGNVPEQAQVQGLLVRGYISVLCVYGTPVRGAAPYVRSVLTANNMVGIGTFDATGDSSNNVVLTATQATWATDGKDPNNNAELRVYR